MRFIARLHRWLGLSIGIVFVLIGLSGSVLVYAPSIVRFLYPVLERPLPANWRDFRPRVFESIAAQYTPGEVLVVRFPGTEYPAYQLYLRDGAQEFRDVLSGRRLLHRGPLDDIVIIARTFHTELFGGATGEQVLGWLGFAMLALLAGGLWTWLPRRTHWRHVLHRPRIRRVHPQLTWWHKTLGVVIVGPLLLVTLTGTALIFYAPAQALLTTALGGKPPAPPSHVVPPRAASTDWPAVFNTLDRTLPAGRTVFFYPPQGDQPLLFRKQMPGELHPNGRSYIALTRIGKLLFANDASRAAAGMQAANAIYPLHSGRLDLAWYRALIALLGVMPLLFFASGLCMWRLRNRAAGRRSP